MKLMHRVLNPFNLLLVVVAIMSISSAIAALMR
jgi:hypothetical protein